MNTIGPIAACLAGLLHVAIFYLEAIAFSQPKIYRRFLVADPNEAQTVKPWAFNQGFYNLFLAIGTLAGGQPLTRQRLAKDVTDETSRRKRAARVLTLMGVTGRLAHPPPHAQASTAVPNSPSITGHRSVADHLLRGSLGRGDFEAGDGGEHRRTGAGRSPIP